MKFGVDLKIDVSKIDKERLYKGDKGTYLSMTVYVDTDTKDQYGNNGMITHKKNKDEQKAPILGNCKVFWSNVQSNHQSSANLHTNNDINNFDDEIPF